MNKTSPAYFTLLVLVYAAVFLTLISALAGYIFMEKRYELAKENREKAFQLAEAGLEYYRWHLAHWPNDLQDGTGHAGPFVHTVADPEGGTLGTYSLDISGGVMCGQLNSVFITATGATTADPLYKRVLTARYTRPSVAEYSTIVNSNVWVGADRIITGPYHSNGGIRMDATHNADVTSGVSTWLCTSSFGCSPNSTQNGVFGAGSQPSLWSFPAPTMDFAGISVDLANLKNYATSSGRYLAPSGNFGYKIVFNSDGTFTASRVTGTTQVWGYTTENGWAQEQPVITTTAAPTTYAIPATCPVVFVEDNAWVEGSVSGKVTFAAADVTAGSIDRSVIVNGNLTYAHASGDGITVIGENNVLVGLQTPDIMTMNGIFIAQKGRFGRNHYCQDDCAGIGSSGDSGVKVPSATPVTTGWSNFTASRLNSSNNSKATCDATCDNNDNGQVSDFTFNIPSGAVISGIQVIAEMAEGASAGSIPTDISLSWNNGTSFTATKSANVNGTSDANYTLGSSSDTWGRTWTDTEFANGTFRVKVDKLPDSDTLSVDYIEVRVYYTTGSGLPSSLDQYVTRSILNTNGTVVSNGRVGTKWTSGSTFVSGYAQRNDTFDRTLAGDPPAFTPTTSDDFKFTDWRDQR